MEKHCERQHGLTPAGGRGHYIANLESQVTERQQVTSPFQQVRTYPAHQGRIVCANPDKMSRVRTLGEYQKEQRIVHPETRYA